MRKVELELKDDFEIIEDGCIYQAPVYEVTDEGLKQIDDTGEENDPFQNQEIRFVRGSKLGSDDVAKRRGTTHEHLLKIMIHDLGFKNNLVPSRETSIAITKLEEAYGMLLQRQIQRQDEKKLNTYEK